MTARVGFILVVVFAGFQRVAADETLYRYEGDVHPTHASAGWICGNPCDPPCSESVEDGHYVLRWTVPNERTGCDLSIAPTTGSPPPPPTLWIEWRFRSNHPIGANFFSCDGAVSVDYDQIHDVVYMYGDTTVSFSGADFVGGYAIEEFHTFRFESTDGVAFTVAVDGLVFMEGTDSKSPGGAYVQMRGEGGCDGFVGTVNEWDFVRYGTIATGETIIASDPPAGVIDPNDFPTLDRFTVTFDAANYVYIDDITVEVTGGIAPTVIQTLRREDTDPDTVEIVLDRPMQLNETTTFTIADGTAINVVEYTVRIPVPAVSTWGSVTMTLTLLVAATLIIKRQSARVVGGQ